MKMTIGLAVAVLIGSVHPVFAITRYVGLTGTPGGTYYTNIQMAVDACNPGDLVLVSNGTYYAGMRVTPGGYSSNRVVIAENIPYLTRQDTTDAGLNYSNYEFKDVGVTLKITPQINQERFVRLQIFQKIEQVVDQEEVGLPSTLKRETQTTVTIKDGHTIVIAGLIDETLTTGNYQVPCLGRIPVLSWLFKTAADTGRKTNLYFFVTPRIIETPDEAQVVYDEKKEAIDTLKESVIRLYDRPGITQERVLEEKELFLERSREVLEGPGKPDESDVPIE